MGTLTHYYSTDMLCNATSILDAYYAPPDRGWGHYKLSVSVCLSVCLSVACLDITRERKGLKSPNLAGWKPIRRVTVNLFRSQKVKGQGHQAD